MTSGYLVTAERKTQILVGAGYHRANIDIEICSECGGEVRVIASIEDSVVIQKILFGRVRASF